MADKAKQEATQDVSADVARIKKTLEMLDERLDNLDSVVSAVVERLTKRHIAFLLSCPHCGKNIEITLIGNEKLTK